MEINRDSAIPLWYQIASILEQEILSQEIQAEGPFATAVALSERFGVNRHTVRQALNSLADKGLVRIEKGSGLFVEKPEIDYAIGQRTRFTTNLLLNNVEPSRDIVSTSSGVAPDHVATALQLSSGAPSIILETIGKADGQPVSFSTVYLSAERFPGFAEVYQREGSITRALSHYGVDDYTRQSTKVTACLPTPRDAQLLEQPKTQPILWVQSLDIDAQHVPIVLNETRFVGERVQLVIQS